MQSARCICNAAIQTCPESTICLLALSELKRLVVASVQNVSVRPLAFDLAISVTGVILAGMDARWRVQPRPRLHRGHSEGAQRHSGLGLGLTALVRVIAPLRSGRLRLGAFRLRGASRVQLLSDLGDELHLYGLVDGLLIAGREMGNCY